MQSSILKNPEEFEKLKEMLTQDAKSSNMNAGFFDDEPEDYPCLVKIRELNHQVLDLEVNESNDVNLGELMNEDLEDINGYYYEFTFLSQKEIKQLLET